MPDHHDVDDDTYDELVDLFDGNLDDVHDYLNGAFDHHGAAPVEQLDDEHDVSPDDSAA
jgi:hypothetical protein